MKRSNSNFSAVLSAIIIFIIAFAVISFLTVKTDTFTAPLKNFHVKCGDDTFFTDREHFEIVKGKSYKFDVNTDIETNDNGSNYIVSIVPNSDVDDFSFTVNGTSVSFHSITSLAKGFIINELDDSFIITANGGLYDVLSVYYNDLTSSEIPSDNLPYFRLVISSVDREECININFSIISE